jgi:AraC family transcriptional regulator of adaptative response / DNA-3-methyladenine glycosylase II
MDFSAVVTTGIYCRPDCSARPNATNVRPYEFAAAAEAAGYRACLRCRPYRSSPPVEWVGPELVCRAVQMVLHGALDDGNEADLGARLGVSARHLRRLFAEHVGATPDQLARSRRAHFARRLLDDTDLTVTDIAFASGYGSVRQLNRACQEIFRASPIELRAKRRRSDRLVADGGLALRLPFDGPLDWPAMVHHVRARAIPGVESVDGDVYRRTIVVNGDPGVLEIERGGPQVLLVTAHLPHWEGLIHVIEQARHIFSLDVAFDEAVRHLSGDRVLHDLLDVAPGRRPLGSWDPFESGVRVIIGQQVSVEGATTLTGRLVERLGDPVPGLAPMGLDRTFPSAATIAAADLDGLGLTSARAEAVRAFAQRVDAGDIVLDGSVSLDQLIASIVAVPGLGPWTAHHIALRLGERDAFPSSDLGLVRAYDRMAPRRGPALDERAAGWSPWRATAATQLWFAEASERPSAPELVGA